MTNTDISRRLRKYAAELSERRENLYRVRAVRRAAEAVLGVPPIEEILANRGRAALEEVPGLGPSLAATIAHYVETGEWLSHPRGSRFLSREGPTAVHPAGSPCSPSCGSCSN